MAIAREPVQIPDITQGGAYQSHVRDLLESNEWKLGRFVFHLDYDVTPGKHCPALWRSAGIGSTHKGSAARDETHFLYPCIGPLSGLDLSFPGAEDFQRLWRNPVFTLLRRAQREPGVSQVCDMCRSADTRDPRHFPRLERIVGEFAREHCGRKISRHNGASIGTSQ